MATSSRFIVHIASDEKFIDMAFREFEAVASGINRLVILGKARPLQHVKSKEACFHSMDSAKSLIQSDECAAVVFHSIGDATLLASIPGGKKAIWLGWGADYYDRLLARAYPEGLLLKQSKALKTQLRLRKSARVFAQKLKAAMLMMLGKKQRYRHDLLKRVDVFSPVLDIEYRMACELNPWFKPQYVTWNYGTVEDDLLPGIDEDAPLGPDILVGNSASVENNHLEAFALLKKYVDLRGRKIIVPLSYGDELYKRKIISIGRKIFGDQFVPLTAFMPKDQYMAILQDCGHVFMNHLRQQALGNICIMMLKGAKIYLNQANPLHRWLIDKGAVIQSIDALVDGNDRAARALEPLTDSECSTNADVIRAHWGRDVQREKTRQLIDTAIRN